MKNFKKCVLSLVVAGFMFVPVLGFSADEADIERIEKQLVQKETEMLDPEIKLDKLIVERAKLDGPGGWFQGAKKKELERQMGECKTQIDRMHGEMVSLQKQVQEAVFAVAYTLEKKGEFKKAIEYYLKVENQDDKVKTRIASCYKSLKDYEQAIQWFLKLTRTDENLLEVVDCYKLDGRMKEAIYWLFQILEPLNGNPAELTALKLIEEYDYPGKKSDYPNFAQRLSDIYLEKAVREYSHDFNQAKTDYEKAVALITGTGDPKSASFGIVARYQNHYNSAIEMLNQQREAAERNYENMLRDAKSNYDQAEMRYRRAQRDAEDEYSRKLEYSRRELNRAEAELEAVQKNASATPEMINQAKIHVNTCRDQYQ